MKNGVCFYVNGATPVPMILSITCGLIAPGVSVNRFLFLSKGSQSPFESRALMVSRWDIAFEFKVYVSLRVSLITMTILFHYVPSCVKRSYKTLKSELFILFDL